MCRATSGGTPERGAGNRTRPMALSLRELLELERTRRAHVDQAFGGIADAVRSIAAASLRIEDNLRGFIGTFGSTSFFGGE